MNKEYPIIKSVYKFIMAGNWTKTIMINKIKEINNIERTANHAACYNQETNTTIIEIYVTPDFESEVNNDD